MWRLVRAGDIPQEVVYVWPLIGSEFGNNSCKLDTKDNSRWAWPSSSLAQVRVRRQAGQSQGSWHVISNWLSSVPVFVLNKPGIPSIV